MTERWSDMGFNQKRYVYDLVRGYPLFVPAAKIPRLVEIARAGEYLARRAGDDGSKHRRHSREG